MKSLDTNILVYASNTAAAEHAKSLAVVNEMLARPSEWILSDQVLWEYYKALRHPRILKKPRTATQAAGQIRFLREKSGVAFCAYETPLYPLVLKHLESPRFPYQRTHDTVLAVTLRHHGAKVLYTRNTKDFAGAGFDEIIDPLA